MQLIIIQKLNLVKSNTTKLLMFDLTKFNFYFSQNEHYKWNADHEELTWKS